MIKVLFVKEDELSRIFITKIHKHNTQKDYNMQKIRKQCGKPGRRGGRRKGGEKHKKRPYRPQKVHIGATDRKSNQHDPLKKHDLRESVI